MHPRLLLQALLLTLVSGFPLPQRTTGFDLSALSSLFGRGSGTGSGAALPAFDLGSLLGGGAAGSGSDGAVSPLTAIPPQFPGSTSNDLVSGQPCKSNILLYSRGAMEGGNMGTSVGPSFQREIEKLAPGKFMFQGVNYDATYQWTLQLERVGGEISKKLIEEAVTKCPDARIFLGGYAHGGMVMHDAVNGTTAANKAKIAGIVTFGDPFHKQPFNGIDASKFKTFCEEADSICNGSIKNPINAAHLQYGLNGDTVEGAQFITGLAA